MPRVSFKSLQRRKSPRNPMSTVATPHVTSSPHSNEPISDQQNFQETTTPTAVITQPYSTQTQPLPNPSLSPQPPSESSLPLGSSGAPQASSRLHTSPPEMNGDTHNHEGYIPPPNRSKTISSIDRRILIGITKEKKFDPHKPAYASLKQIIHSHYDGPHFNWSGVPDLTIDGWWEAFKGLYKWNNRYPEEAVFIVFSHWGGRHFRQVFSKAKKQNKKPVWMQQDTWEDILHIWATDVPYIRRVEVNKRNRAVGIEKGTPPFRGGSASITEHKKRLKLKHGVQPSIRDTFKEVYGNKDGTIDPAAGAYLEKFDDLVEKANEEALANGSTNDVDENLLWITATGGVKKNRVAFMGSESQSIIGNVIPYGVEDEAPISTQHNLSSLREEVMGLKAQMEKYATVDETFDDKMAQMEERVTKDLGEKVVNLQDKVEQMKIAVEKVQTDAEVNIGAVHIALDKMMENQNAFFSSIKNMLKKT